MKTLAEKATIKQGVKQEILEQKEMFYNTGVFVIMIGNKTLIPKPSKESGLVVEPVELTKEEQQHFEIKHYIEKGILVKA